MRATYIPELKKESEYILTGERLHHLVNVIRIEEGEELLLFNGSGFQIKTLVTNVSKRELRLKFLEEQSSERKYILDLVIGMPKRDALDLSLKQATELGFRRIFLIKSGYSQMRFPEKERLENLLVSALEQANASFLPEVVESTWDNIPWDDYPEGVLMDSQTMGKPWKTSEFKVEEPKILIVGPEGGFTAEELSFLHQKENLKVLNLPTPILRTPTAVAAGAGFLLQSLLNC